MASPGQHSSTRLQRKLTSIEKVGGINCHICNATFGNKKDFDTHYSEHNNENNQIIYTCVKCHKEFPEYPSFRGHCYTFHVIKEKFKCDVCCKAFSKETALRDHNDKFHNFKCSQCGIQFSSKTEYELHKIVHKQQSFSPTCQVCDESILSIDSCEYHIDKHSKFIYTCPICTEEVEKNTATEHLKIHFGHVLNEDKTDYEVNNIPDESAVESVGGILCNVCDTPYKDKKEFDQHYKLEHNDTIIYSCNICGRQIGNFRVFAHHCYNHITKERYTCDVCEKSFSRLSSLVLHSEQHMSNEKPYACIMCDSRFASERRLRDHHKEQHGVPVNTIPCLVQGCGETFETPKELIFHQRQHNSDLDNWCRQCGMAFASAGACNRHMDIHRKKTYQCPVCGKHYGEKYLIMKHIQSHFAEMLYICKVCTKAYNGKFRLVEHMKIHSEVRNHNCKFCGKNFLSLKMLDAHLVIHYGQKPFQCTACTKSFASYPNWTKHLMRMHNIDHKTIQKRPTVVENKSTPVTDNEVDAGEIKKTGEQDNGVLNIECIEDTGLKQGGKVPTQNYIETPIIIMQTQENYNIDKTALSNSESTGISIEQSVEEDLEDAFEYVQKESGFNSSTIGPFEMEESPKGDVMMEIDNINPTVIEKQLLILSDETNNARFPNVLPELKEVSFATDTSSHDGIVSEAIYTTLQSVDFPREYGPEFLTGVETTDFQGHYISLDDDNLPHIDPMLTIKPDTSKPETMEQSQSNVSDNYDQNSLLEGIVWEPPVITKCYEDYLLTDTTYNMQPIMSTDIF